MSAVHVTTDRTALTVEAVMALVQRIIHPRVPAYEQVSKSLRSANNTIFSAWQGDCLLGYTCVHVKVTAIHTTGAIDGVAVAAEYEGNGVGFSLMTAVRQWAKEQGCDRLSLETDNPRAIALYERSGLRIATGRLVMLGDI